MKKAIQDQIEKHPEAWKKAKGIILQSIEYAKGKLSQAEQQVESTAKSFEAKYPSQWEKLSGVWGTLSGKLSATKDSMVNVTRAFAEDHPDQASTVQKAFSDLTTNVSETVKAYDTMIKEAEANFPEEVADIRESQSGGGWAKEELEAVSAAVEAVENVIPKDTAAETEASS